jgi:phosphatidylserine/phosphatidylglycerophosphate/cardiolipin synthase-like enzyme
MDYDELERALAETLGDRQLSRAERRAFGELLAESGAGPEVRARLTNTAFKLARAEVVDPSSHAVLDWLQQVVGLLHNSRHGGDADVAPPAPLHGVEAYFSPGEQCVTRIVSLIRGATRTIDVCVFTITDDRISLALGEAHRRRVAVRVITDDEKAFEPGSDARAFARIGIPVRVDGSPYHMHHKFALFDAQTVLTGSYNWTRGAAMNNEENLIVTSDDRLVRAFQGEFDRLWTKFAQHVLQP